MDPYRQAVERRVERGACMWCFAEVKVIDEDEAHCAACGSATAAASARKTHARLVAEYRNPPRRPRPWAVWAGNALAWLGTASLAAGATGAVLFMAWLMITPDPPAAPALGFMLCSPFAAIALLRYPRPE